MTFEALAQMSAVEFSWSDGWLVVAIGAIIAVLAMATRSRHLASAGWSVAIVTLAGVACVLSQLPFVSRRSPERSSSFVRTPRFSTRWPPLTSMLSVDVWMHHSYGTGTGSVDETAAADGREHGITVIADGCPLMFDPIADFGYKVMRVIYRGHIPKPI